MAGFILLFGQFSAGSVLAASEYFSPSVGTYSAHAQFTVGVYASSSDQPASAFSAHITFPADKLQIVSLSKVDSIIALWVQEPWYSNTQGTLDFEGLIPNPGYTGSGGKLLNVTFEVVGNDVAHLSFANGSILANDGKGTDITTELGAAGFVLSDEQGDALQTEAGSADSGGAGVDIGALPADRQSISENAQSPFKIPALVLGAQAASFFGDEGVADNQLGTASAVFLLVLELLIFVAIVFVLFAALIYTLFVIAKLLHMHGRSVVQGMMNPETRRIRSTYQKLHDDIYVNLYRLERLRSGKKSPKIERMLSSTTEALRRMEDEIDRFLKES